MGARAPFLFQKKTFIHLKGCTAKVGTPVLFPTLHIMAKVRKNKDWVSRELLLKYVNRQIEGCREGVTFWEKQLQRGIEDRTTCLKMIQDFNNGVNVFENLLEHINTI